MNSHPFVSAIIVNYKSADYAIDCIQSLLDQQNVRLEIIVIDNASGDGSTEKLSSVFSNKIQLIESETNLGFGKANNLAARMAKGNYLLVINPDLKLLTPLDLAILVAELYKTANAGVIGPQISEPRHNHLVRPKLSYKKQRLLRFTPDIALLPGNIAWILGACMLFPTKAYQTIGGFDEDFFLYGEDTDICLRLRKAGYIVAWTDKVKVEHWGGASEISAAAYDKWTRKKRGFYLFCIKHYSPADSKRIMHKAMWDCRIKILALNCQKYLIWKNPASTQLQIRLDRLRAELDVVQASLKQYPWNCLSTHK